MSGFFYDCVMSIGSVKKRLIPVGILITAIVIAFLLYKQAEGMMWGFDDYINLRGLADVSSRDGLIDFLFGGVAGPGGRVISLLTFLANYADWPVNPWGFSETTLILHCINGMLVFLFVQRLYQKDSVLSNLSSYMSALGAILWLLLPIHASGILLPVQRMTHVSAFFVLLTLYGYVLVRNKNAPSIPSVLNIFFISALLFIGGSLAYFSKENGVMVATLVALVEFFFFFDIKSWSSARGGRRMLWVTWLSIAGLLVTLLLFVHLYSGWDGIQNNYKFNRDFSLSERLASESIILWEYMRQSFLPRTFLLGPYHDGHPVYSWSMFLPYVATAAWSAVIGGGIFLYFHVKNEFQRNIIKYALFAIFWFLCCHQIESTFIPLELYFEHRNYLAVLGFCFLLIYILFGLFKFSDKRIIVVLFGVLYFAFIIITLQQITKLWGSPFIANEVWRISNPGSTRAQQSAVNDLLTHNRADEAFRVANNFIERTRSIDLAIQMIPKVCQFSSIKEQALAFSRVEVLADSVSKPSGISTGLASLGDAVRQGRCEGISSQEYKKFLYKLLLNKSVSGYSPIRHHVHYEIALMEKEVGNVSGYVEYAKKAFFDFPSLSIGEAIAITLFREKKPRDAIAWIDELMQNTPNGMMREAWGIRLQSLKNALKIVVEKTEGWNEGDVK